MTDFRKNKSPTSYLPEGTYTYTLLRYATLRCRFCALLPCVFVFSPSYVWQIIIFVHYDIIFTTRILITLSNCRTAGRYATPAALYLFLHTYLLRCVLKVTHTHTATKWT